MKTDFKIAAFYRRLLDICERGRAQKMYFGQWKIPERILQRFFGIYSNYKLNFGINPCTIQAKYFAGMVETDVKNNVWCMIFRFRRFQEGSRVGEWVYKTFPLYTTFSPDKTKLRGRTELVEYVQVNRG